MYHTVNEFLEEWAFESQATLRVLKNLTDESLNKKLNERVRTPGILAWHLTITISEMISKTGLSFRTVDEKLPVPVSANVICETYKKSSGALSDAIRAQWDDQSLKEKILIYGETWTKEKVLSALVKHQIHHRGQLTVLLREAGLKVPGIYGPSYEEWENFGASAPA